MVARHRVKGHASRSRSGRREWVRGHLARNPEPYAFTEHQYHDLFGEHPLAGRSVSEIREFEKRRNELERSNARSKRVGFRRAYRGR